MKRITSFSRTLHVVIFSLLVFASGDTALSQVTIASGTFVSTTGNVQIVIADLDVNNAGIIDASQSTFHFSGTGNNSISGTGSFITFNNMTINKMTDKELTLNVPLHITGIVNFLSGNIELNNQSVDLNNTGSFMRESDASRVTGVYGGSIQADAILNSPNAVNIGNLGAVITSAANLGTVYITRKHQPVDIAGAGNKSINRSFEIAIPGGSAMLILRSIILPAS